MYLKATSENENMLSCVSVQKSIQCDSQDIDLTTDRDLCSLENNGNKYHFYDKTSSLGQNDDAESTVDSDDGRQANQLHLISYFQFLDDYIRFDIYRTGVSCSPSYSIGVQYEDDFIIGKDRVRSWCHILCCNAKSQVLMNHNEKSFEIEYFPRVSCTKPKNCVYQVKLSEQKNVIGTIHYFGDLVHIYDAYEKCLFLRQKQEPNLYSIKTDSGDILASIEIFRGVRRGDIRSYALSILGNASPVDKALLIGLTISMDIRQREAEMRCSFIWVPLCCFIVIVLFSVIPMTYFKNDDK